MDEYKTRLNEIGGLIKNWRVNEGYTRKELSAASGVYHKSIYRVEIGENMTVLNLMKIADGLGVRIQDLLYEDVD
jgi:transcriptional regulator with XRE-family HTH domain